MFSRFETVEWLYDGLNGKIIPWTKQNGGTSDDPSVLTFAVGHDGKVIEKCADAEAHQPKAFAAWLRARADAWEKIHPRTKVPFEPAVLAVSGEGAARTVSCAAMDEAKAAKRPVALYIGREERSGDEAKAKAEIAACRKFEKEALGADEPAKAAAGWLLLRLDRADADQALLAKSLGVETAPAVVLLAPGAEKPVVLDRQATGGSLAYQLKKLAPAGK